MKLPLVVLRLRFWVQMAVLIFLCLLPGFNAKGWYGIMGNFYALNIFDVPFSDPLGLIQNLANGFSPEWQLWLGSALTLAIAVLLGRVFCGWICPYGFLSECLWQIAGKQQKLAPPKAWLWRGLLTMLGLVGVFALGYPVLNALSGPGLLSLAPQLFQGGLGVALAALSPLALLLVLEGISGQRWWCRYACPQALFLMVAAGMGRAFGKDTLFGVSWQSAKCTCKGSTPCAKVCSVGLQPRQKSGPSRAHCLQCADCVKVCANKGKALSIGCCKNKTD